MPQETPLRILGNRLLVKRLPFKPVSRGGIHLLSDYDRDDRQWEVIAVGSGRKLKSGRLVPLEIKPGDRVLLRHVHGNDLVLEDGSWIVPASEAIMVW